MSIPAWAKRSFPAASSLGRCRAVNDDPKTAHQYASHGPHRARRQERRFGSIPRAGSLHFSEPFLHLMDNEDYPSNTVCEDDRGRRRSARALDSHFGSARRLRPRGAALFSIARSMRPPASPMRRARTNPCHTPLAGRLLPAADRFAPVGLSTNAGVGSPTCVYGRHLQARRVAAPEVPAAAAVRVGPDRPNCGTSEGAVVRPAAGF